MIELIKVDKNIDLISEVIDYKYIFKFVKDDKIIGCGTINNDTESNIFIYIEEELRGNGYGKLLFSKMLLETQKLGYKEVKLKFTKENIQMLKIVKHHGGLHLSTNADAEKYLIPLK